MIDLPNTSKMYPVDRSLIYLPRHPLDAPVFNLPRGMESLPVEQSQIALPRHSEDVPVFNLPREMESLPVEQSQIALPTVSFSQSTINLEVDSDLSLVSNSSLETVPEPTVPSLSIQDTLLNDSRLTPNGNGSLSSKQLYTQPPTNGQKWWAAVIFGFIFGLVSSPAAYYATSKLTSNVGNVVTMHGTGPNFIGLLMHSIIFILIIRLVLW